MSSCIRPSTTKPISFVFRNQSPNLMLKSRKSRHPRTVEFLELKWTRRPTSLGFITMQFFRRNGFIRPSMWNQEFTCHSVLNAELEGGVNDLFLTYHRTLFRSTNVLDFDKKEHYKTLCLNSLITYQLRTHRCLAGTDAKITRISSISSNVLLIFNCNMRLPASSSLRTNSCCHRNLWQQICLIQPISAHKNQRKLYKSVHFRILHCQVLIQSLVRSDYLREGWQGSSTPSISAVYARDSLVWSFVVQVNFYLKTHGLHLLYVREVTPSFYTFERHLRCTLIY